MARIRNGRSLPQPAYYARRLIFRLDGALAAVATRGVVDGNARRRGRRASMIGDADPRAMAVAVRQPVMVPVEVVKCLTR